MTFNDLSQLYYLRGEIAAYENRIKELESLCDVKSPTYGDRVKSGSTGGSIIERTAVQIADLKLLIKERQVQCLCEEYKLTEWINGINDSYLRTAFYLRFVKGYRWRNVADNLGGGNTANGVLMACKRYCDNN